MTAPATKARRSAAASRPPHDPKTEEALLGSILLSKGAIEVALEAGVAAADFYIPAHGSLYAAALALHGRGEGVDEVTLAAELGDDLEAAGGRKELLRIKTATPASANARAYTTTVKSLAQRRMIQVTARELETAAATGNGLESAKAALLELTRRPMAARPESSLVNAAELLALTFPPQRWAVPGIVAEGLNLLVGPPKLGKSWFALNLAVAISTGGVALGRVPVDQGPVLYLALEDSRRRLQDRLAKVLQGSPAPETLHFITEWNRLDDGGDQKLRAHLDEYPDTRSGRRRRLGAGQGTREAKRWPVRQGLRRRVGAASDSDRVRRHDPCRAPHPQG